MGRKKRKGRSGLWVNPKATGQKNLSCPDKERYVRHLDNKNRVTQFLNSLNEVHPPNIPHKVTCTTGSTHSVMRGSSGTPALTSSGPP